MPDSSLDRAKEDGQVVLGIGEAVKKSEIILMLIPDEVQAGVYAEHVSPNLREGMTLCFARKLRVTP